MREKLILIALLSGLLSVAEAGYKFTCDVGDECNVFCPKRQFVSRLDIGNGINRYQMRDFKFYIECDTFYDRGRSDNEDEKCVIRSRFKMPDGEVLISDHNTTCQCDEYMSGLRTWIAERKDRRGRVLSRTRMVQMKCCYQENKIVNITSCHYSGPKFTLAPWPVQIRTKDSYPKKPKDVIQSFTINENYLSARMCAWVINGRDISEITYKTNKCEWVKQKSIKDVYDKIKGWIEGDKCVIPTANPFGWPESTDWGYQFQQPDLTAISKRDSRLYKKQYHHCRDGSYLYAVHKYARQGPKGKDYIFLTKCHELTFTVCYCFWKTNCTHPDKRNESATNETWYVAGWRSQWDEEMGHRKIELMCCKSKGLKMLYCNTTRNYTDNDISLVVQRPRYKWDAFLKPKVIDAEVIRDVDHWVLENGTILMRFNVCRVNGSDGDCEEQCWDCRDIDPTGEICRQTTSTSTTSTTTTTISTSTTATTSTTTTTGSCAENAIYDLLFFMDESGSVGASNFEAEKSFVQGMVSQFTLGPSQSRVGVTKFSTLASPQWTFTSETQTNANIEAKVAALPYNSGSTHITAALQSSISTFSTQSRPGVPQIALLLTDGNHNQGDPPPTDPAATLRNMGIEMFVVTIGDEIDFNVMEEIAGDPARVFRTQFDTLDAQVITIAEELCQIAAAG